MRIAVFGLMAMTTCALAMMDEAPPVKMGLWEKTEVTTVSVPVGMEGRAKAAGMVPGVPKTTKSKACYTAESWEKAIGLEPAVSGCTVSKRTLNAKGAKVSVHCDVRGIAMSTDATFTFDSAEAWHGEAHSTTVYPANMMGSGGGTATSVNAYKATYVGPACGDVPAGKQVIEP